jgi:thiol:disulfide interchange protein DsbD
MGVLLVVLAGSVGSGQAGEAADKAPPTAKLIDFSIQVTPSPLSVVDPFSDANKAGVTLKDVKPGQAFRLTITGTPKQGFHTYPLTRRSTQQQEEQLSTLTYDKSDIFVPLWPILESPPQAVNEGSELGILLEHAKPFTWTQDIYVRPEAKPQTAHLKFKVRLQVCDEKSCLWGDHLFNVPLAVVSGPAEPINPELKTRLETKDPGIEVVSVSAEEVESPKGSSGTSGLLAFILQGMFWGAISLVTPCVFPMIPITVSFFLKQSEKEHNRPILMAAVYCGTIVTVLTISAVALLSVFQEVSTHPITNFFMGGLFIFFALSLFGMYDIELPSGLAAFTSKREGQGGLIGTMFMALTFTIISFACVAPFLGGFGGTAAGGGSTLSWTHRIFGGLAFSATFASPFFVLALFPSLMRKMPRAGTWMNSVKVVMGFLELAAALKFIRAGELVALPEATYFTFDTVMALYVAIAVMAGLYLLNVYRLPHDTPVDNLGVMRMLMGLSFLGLGIYLAPSLMKSYDKKEDRWYSQRSTGVVYAWVESFLLPDSQGELPWQRSLEKGLAEARQKGRLVFVDFTGETCTNCSYNENSVFTKPTVKELLLKYTLVQLYTDKVKQKLYTEEELQEFGTSVARQKEEAAANRKFQGERFNDTRLPLYVILQPLGDGKFREVARYDEGKINDPAAFVRFLRNPLQGRSAAATDAKGK